MTGDLTRQILQEVFEERLRQDVKWGEQSWPDGTDEIDAGFRDYLIKKCDEAAMNGSVTWTHILSEELLESFAETDYAPLRKELIQSAAVIVNWLEDMDRKEQQ